MSSHTKPIIFYAYEIDPITLDIFHNIDFQNHLTTYLQKLDTVQLRMRHSYKKEEITGSQVIGDTNKYKECLFGSFFTFANQDLFIFLDNTKLENNSISPKDLQEKEEFKDYFGYKSHIYFMIFENTLITTSNSYKVFEKYLNTLLEDSGFPEKLHLKHKIANPKEIKLSDIDEIIFYEWESDLVTAKLEKPTSLISVATEYIKSTFNTTNHESITKHAVFKPYLTCEMKIPSGMDLEEYKKQLGFALRFTDEMKGKLTIKTKNGQKLEGDKIIEQKKFDIIFKEQVIVESDLSVKMREYIHELNKNSSY